MKFLSCNILLVAWLLGGKVDARKLLRRGLDESGDRLLHPKSGKSETSGSSSKSSSSKSSSSETSSSESSSPTKEPLEVPGPGTPRGLAFLMTGTSLELEIISCNETSVEIKGTRANELVTGTLFITILDSDLTCSACSPLVRKVTGVTMTTSGTMILSTALGTYSDIIDTTLVKDEFKNQVVETILGCPSRRVLTGENLPVGHLRGDFLFSFDDEGVVPLPELSVVDDKDVAFLPDLPSTRLLLGFCSSNWLQKNADGGCTHTNCFVGPTGDPNNCFVCSQTCDNGCSASGSVFNLNGDLNLTEFDDPCCNHDHCWLSNDHSKTECDQDYFTDMRAECPEIPFLVSLDLNTAFSQRAEGSCDILAYLFATAAWLDPIGTYTRVQGDQNTYESSDVCVAKCPTLQASGGQEYWVRQIDMLRTNGTFLIEYDMYPNPDHLFIEYEGNRIFDTGGQVSGFDSTFVTFSGSSTRIWVTVNATNEGTGWELSVYCPDRPDLPPPVPETVILYENNFESLNPDQVPEEEVRVGCPLGGQNEDDGINRFYGTDKNRFNQPLTTEVFVVNSMWNSSTPYADPSGRAGAYAIAFQCGPVDCPTDPNPYSQNDLLALGFDTQGKDYVNVAMDISSIDNLCDEEGGTGDHGVAIPIFNVSLLDYPKNLSEPPYEGTILDFDNMTGGGFDPSGYTFLWTPSSVSLSTAGSSTGRVSVVFDLIQSGYGALDNLCIVASNEPGVAKCPTIVDRPDLPPTEPEMAYIAYQNSFESPLRTVEPYNIVGCPMDAYAGDPEKVNDFYGTPANPFSQPWSTEVWAVKSQWNSSTPYVDPDGRAGSYAIAFLCGPECPTTASLLDNDKLALGVDPAGFAFLNVAMDISSIDTNELITDCVQYGSGDNPIFRVSLLDYPAELSAELSEPPYEGTTELASATMEGTVGPNDWTFQWTRNSVSLSTAGSTNGRVSVVFDLIQGGYGALDNLCIIASDEPLLVAKCPYTG